MIQMNISSSTAVTQAMDRLRWFFALRDSRDDVSGKDKDTLVFERMLRQRASPLFRFIWRCERWGRQISTLGFNLWKVLWHATIGRWVYVKNGRFAMEAETMRFVSSQTSIPLPRVWANISYKDRHYILMARISGVVLEDAWDQLPFDTKAIVAEQLAGYISQLRAITPPPDVRAICSLAGGPVQCHRLHDDGVAGPFRDEDHMNFQLRHCRPMDAYPAFVQSAHSKSHPLVFTHNDLFPRNIMIDQTTGQVLAVLDWESAGWFPSHWEYCKSRNWGIWKPYQQEWMNEWVPKVIPAYEEEAKADRFLMYESGLSSLNPIRHAP